MWRADTVSCNSFDILQQYIISDRAKIHVPDGIAVQSECKCESPVTSGTNPVGQVALLWLDGPVSRGPEVGSVKANTTPCAAPSHMSNTG